MLQSLLNYFNVLVSSSVQAKPSKRGWHNAQLHASNKTKKCLPQRNTPLNLSGGERDSQRKRNRENRKKSLAAGFARTHGKTYVTNREFRSQVANTS